MNNQICSSFFPSFSTISSSGNSCSSLSSRISSSCGDGIDNDAGDDDNVDDDDVGTTVVVMTMLTMMVLMTMLTMMVVAMLKMTTTMMYMRIKKIDLAEMIDNARPNGISKNIDRCAESERKV